MNSFLLLKVRQAILDRPYAFDMSTWDCGTQACIAGWIVRLAGGNMTGINCVFEEARKLLKLSKEQAGYLFQSWISNPNLNMTAQEAAQHIDRFIESDGAVPE